MGTYRTRKQDSTMNRLAILEQQHRTTPGDLSRLNCRVTFSAREAECLSVESLRTTAAAAGSGLIQGMDQRSGEFRGVDQARSRPIEIGVAVDEMNPAITRCACRGNLWPSQ